MIPFDIQVSRSKVRPNKEIPLFLVSRPFLIFTSNPNTFYRIWVDQRKRGRKMSRRSVFLQEYNLASVCTIRLVTNVQKLQFKNKKAGNDFINQYKFSMPWSSWWSWHESWHRSEILKKKRKTKKIFRPTYPNFYGHVTGNTHTFLFGLMPVYFTFCNW